VTPTDKSVTVGKIDINGGELFLDADDDTSITADTDDQIDIKIAGADDFQFTANTFTAQSGSTITTPTLGVGNTKDLGDGIHIKISDTGASTNTGFDELVIEKDSNCGISILSGNDDGGALIFGDDGDNDIGNIFYNHNGDYMAFNVNAAERMRIDSNGDVGIGTSDPTSTLHVEKSVHNTAIVNFNNSTGSTPYGIFLTFGGASPDSHTPYFLNCSDSTTNRCIIKSDGDLLNHDNSYGQISDERIKQNITNANSQWDDIKSIKVRNFERKDDIAEYGEGKKVQIGVVAQEVETVSPGLIKEGEPMAEDIKMSSEFGTLYTSDDAETQDAVLYTSSDQAVIDGDKDVGDVKTKSTKQVGDIKSLTGEKVKTVSYSVLYMKAIKALQEAMAKIETLETKVKALEDA